MRGLAVFLTLCCSIAVISGMIKMKDGFKDASRTFHGYKGKSLSTAKQEVAEQLPNVEIDVWDMTQLMEYPDEAFFGKIRIVVDDNGMVVVDPYYFGTEPDLAFANDMTGKDYSTVVTAINTHVPDMKIVVKNPSGDILYDSKASIDESYILVTVDDNEIMNDPPKYVRVLSPR